MLGNAYFRLSAQCAIVAVVTLGVYGTALEFGWGQLWAAVVALAVVAIAAAVVAVVALAALAAANVGVADIGTAAVAALAALAASVFAATFIVTGVTDVAGVAVAGVAVLAAGVATDFQLKYVWTLCLLGLEAVAVGLILYFTGSLLSILTFGMMASARSDQLSYDSARGQQSSLARRSLTRFFHILV
jgi:hypothetical protein